MTTITRKPLYESKTSKESLPFVKFGAFDENNYKVGDLAKAKENELNYTPIRLVAGDRIQGAIAGVNTSKFGDILELVDVTILRSKSDNCTDQDGASEVQIGVSVDLKNKLAFKKKSVGDIVTIEYLGKHPSPKNPSQLLHKVNVE